MSQECFSFSVFSFLPVDSLHSSQAASVAILPSALLAPLFATVLIFFTAGHLSLAPLSTSIALLRFFEHWLRVATHGFLNA
jgi:hypothetical protein